MNNVNATILQSLQPFMGSMGMFTDNPIRDASSHFDSLADNFAAEITYHGIDFYVEVNRHSRNVSDITQIDTGDCWYYDLSESALRTISKMAFEKEQQ